MRAINEVHPDLHIVFINGPAESRGAADDGAHFALLRAFVDGLLSECTGQARITGQMGLDYRSPVSFAAARPASPGRLCAASAAFRKSSSTSISGSPLR